MTVAGFASHTSLPSIQPQQEIPEIQELRTRCGLEFGDDLVNPSVFGGDKAGLFEDAEVPAGPRSVGADSGRQCTGRHGTFAGEDSEDGPPPMVGENELEALGRDAFHEDLESRKSRRKPGG